MAMQQIGFVTIKTYAFFFSSLHNMCCYIDSVAQQRSYARKQRTQKVCIKWAPRPNSGTRANCYDNVMGQRPLPPLLLGSSEVQEECAIYLWLRTTALNLITCAQGVHFYACLPHSQTIIWGTNMLIWVTVSVVFHVTRTDNLFYSWTDVSSSIIVTYLLTFKNLIRRVLILVRIFNFWVCRHRCLFSLVALSLFFWSHGVSMQC